MDPPKSRVSELEEAKSSPLDRHGDFAHQQKLTKKVLWKLDIRYGWSGQVHDRESLANTF